MVSRRRTLAVILLGALIAIASAGFIYLEPWASSGIKKETRRVSLERSSPDLDPEIELPGGPIGFAAAGSDLLLANRDDPWGFIRLRRGRIREVVIESP